MKVIMDADCLIKLTKAQLKESVCAAFSVAIPAQVRREVMANATEHPECTVVEANIAHGVLKEVAQGERGLKGEEAALLVYRSGPYAGVATDDKRFIRKLRILNVRYITPAVFILLLVRRSHWSVAEGLAKLDHLAPLISDDEVAVVRLALQALRKERI